MSLTPAQSAMFDSWLAEHRGIVAKVTRSYAQSPADAADLEQELWLQLWLSVPAYAGTARASTWIYRVCLNTALTWRRGVTRREQRIQPGGNHDHLTAPAPSPADSAGDRELLEKLYAAIQAMPTFDRALVLLLLDGLAYREIAEITGLTENHVGVALTRARQRLAAGMKGLIHEL